MFELLFGNVDRGQLPRQSSNNINILPFGFLWEDLLDPIIIRDISFSKSEIPFLFHSQSFYSTDFVRFSRFNNFSVIISLICMLTSWLLPSKSSQYRPLALARIHNTGYVLHVDMVKLCVRPFRRIVPPIFQKLIRVRGLIKLIN